MWVILWLAELADQAWITTVIGDADVIHTVPGSFV
jgi:hypothetical protein